MPVTYYTEGEYRELLNQNEQLRNNAERHKGNVLQTKLLLDEKDATNHTLARALMALWQRLGVTSQDEALAKLEKLL
jgi:hypothetical protein